MNFTSFSNFLELDNSLKMVDKIGFIEELIIYLIL
jgi:hypothetical protein